MFFSLKKALNKICVKYRAWSEYTYEWTRKMSESMTHEDFTAPFTHSKYFLMITANSKNPTRCTYVCISVNCKSLSEMHNHDT